MANGIPSEPGSAGGASGSTQFGSASGLREELRQATEGQPGQQPAAPPPGQQAPPPQPTAPQAPDAQPPAQDSPPAPGRYQLPQPFPEIELPWRRQLREWANHPKAGSAIKRLAELANRHRG